MIFHCYVVLLLKQMIAKYFMAVIVHFVVFSSYQQKNCMLEMCNFFHVSSFCSENQKKKSKIVNWFQLRKSLSQKSKKKLLLTVIYIYIESKMFIILACVYVELFNVIFPVSLYLQLKATSTFRFRFHVTLNHEMPIHYILIYVEMIIIYKKIISFKTVTYREMLYARLKHTA